MCVLQDQNRSLEVNHRLIVMGLRTIKIFTAKQSDLQYIKIFRKLQY